MYDCPKCVINFEQRNYECNIPLCQVIAIVHGVCIQYRVGALLVLKVMLHRKSLVLFNSNPQCAVALLQPMAMKCVATLGACSSLLLYDFVISFVRQR